MAVDVQGHFKELESLLRLLEQPKPDDDVAAAPPEEEEEEEDAIVLAEDADASGGSVSHRQTFLFSATLMLPPKARDAYAKRLQKRKVRARLLSARLLSARLLSARLLSARLLSAKQSRCVLATDRLRSLLR